MFKYLGCLRMSILGGADNLTELKKVSEHWSNVRPCVRQKFPNFLFSQVLEKFDFRTFQKLQKNDVQLEIRKSQKTRSNSITDSKVRLKVRNAGP